MDNKVKDQIEYLIAMISEFANRHSLTLPQSYRYLKRYKGIYFIDKFYNVNHTLSFETVVDDVTQYCHRQGGGLV